MGRTGGDAPSNSATAELGRGISRHAAVYGCGLMLTILLGIANVVVMTRFLPPSEFGELATLLFFAELSAVLYNLGSMQGGLAIAFGGAMDDDVNLDDDQRPDARDRAALGTTLLLTAGIGLMGAAAVAVAGGAIGDSLVDDPDDANLVVMASGIALFTALWRVLAVVPHHERRPMTFVLLSNARPALMTVGAVPLLVAGHGVEGAMLGGFAGSTAAAALGMAMSAGRLGLRPRLGHVARIFVAGAAIVPAVLALWLLRNAEVYLLAQLASAREVGIFRVASRAGALMYFPVSAILMGWAAFRQDPILRAAERERGRAAVGALVATYFAIATLWIEVGLAIGADVLVEIAPPDYASAAPLIPLVALGLLIHGWFLVVYRLGRFPRRRLAYDLIVVGELVVFVVGCVLFIPSLGATGAGVALVVAPVAAAAATLVLTQRGSAPVPFEYGRLAAAVATAVTLYVLSVLAMAGTGDAAPVLSSALFLAYPPVLIALGVISRRERRQLVDAARSLLPPRARRRAADIAAERKIA